MSRSSAGAASLVVMLTVITFGIAGGEQRRTESMIYPSATDPRFGQILEQFGENPVAAEYVAAVQGCLARGTLSDTLCSYVLTDARDAPYDVMALTKGVCAVVQKESLREEGGRWTLATTTCQTYGQIRAKEIVGTAFLYGDSVVATAKHVLDECGGAERAALVFDFMVTDSTPVGPTSFRHDQVVTEVSEISSASPTGWVLLSFRKQLGRRPLSTDFAFRDEGDSVFALGHPFGLPMKYHGPSAINCSHMQCPYFTSRLNMYPYNSGSPIFSLGGTVIGIHEAGPCNRARCAVEIARRTVKHRGTRGGCPGPCCGSDHIRIAEVTGTTQPPMATVITAQTVAIIDARGAISPPQRFLLVTPESPVSLYFWCGTYVEFLTCDDPGEDPEEVCNLIWDGRTISPGEHWTLVQSDSSNSMCVEMVEE